MIIMIPTSRIVSGDSYFVNARRRLLLYSVLTVVFLLVVVPWSYRVSFSRKDPDAITVWGETHRTYGLVNGRNLRLNAQDRTERYSGSIESMRIDRERQFAAFFLLVLAITIAQIHLSRVQRHILKEGVQVDTRKEARFWVALAFSLILIWVSVNWILVTYWDDLELLYLGWRVL
jgi:hypothetical protein